MNHTGLPDEALDELLFRASRKRNDIAQFALAEPTNLDGPRVVIDHHFAHACASYLTSSFETATIVVCDTRAPEVTLWTGNGDVARLESPWQGAGFATVYSEAAKAVGFTDAGREPRMEALARFDPTKSDPRTTELFTLEEDGLRVAADWRGRVEAWAGCGPTGPQTAAVAAAVQSRLTSLLLEFLARVKRRTAERRNLCLAGGLFHNSHINAAIKTSGIFEQVHVPLNPGNAGLAVGTALYTCGAKRGPVSPFLGPCHTAEETKAALDNCKLRYDLLSDAESMSVGLDGVMKGHLVGWFEGAMEWGPRALGGRSIIASPFSPYVLENLNRFLKRRPPWRGYALSVLESAIHDHFEGAGLSPFMECDYVPKDRERFKGILPGPNASLRIQTVGSDAPPRFQALLRAFGERTGVPALVNTSFNEFHEPIVCSPRDAVRVFFGTGLDTLVLDRFVIKK